MRHPLLAPHGTAVMAAALTTLLLAAGCNERVNVNTGDIRTCDTDRCSGPAPGAPSYTCPDGTVAGPACVQNADGTCGWRVLDCAPDEGDCTEEECGPQPSAPRCGGKTLTAQCLRDSNGECSWRFPRCGVPSCTEEDCGPVKAIARICEDGSVASVTCQPSTSGTCEWVEECPDECPEGSDCGAGCEVGGQRYEVGEEVPSPDGCNSCTCQEGGLVACTARACAPTTCEYNGQKYEVGEVFDAKDGCNTCQCMEDGQVGCTLVACYRWFRTCGDPVCMSEPKDDPAVRNCTEEDVEGAACSDPESECELLDGCGTRLRCTVTDPTQQPGGCPISKAKYKKDVEYLDEAQLEKVAQQLLSIPLATYKYNAAGAARGADATSRHLGFIIDDVGPSACVNPGGETVNLYGYTSMAVAALQVQAKEIAALKSELAALRKELARARRK